MILMFLIDPQQAASDSTEIARMYLPLPPFCARISLQDTYTRFLRLIPAVMNIRLSCTMDIRQDLLLDFSENIPHITPRFHR